MYFEGCFALDVAVSTPFMLNTFHLPNVLIGTGAARAGIDIAASRNNILIVPFS